MTPDPGTLVVPRRFRGPAGSGNGGWTSGALALHLAPGADGPPPARVRLSAPPPLERPMTVSRADGGTLTATDGGRPVLAATALGPDAVHELQPVPPVPHDVALAAGDRFAGLDGHPFPECFACGPERAPGDGLRLRPGPVEHPGVGVAATWVPGGADAGPDGLVPVPLLWAALDCPGGWSVDIVGRPMVLGTMTARVLGRPRPGAPCVVTGRAVEVAERKARTAASLYGPDGELLATAAHVWVAVDPATFGRPA